MITITSRTRKPIEAKGAYYDGHIVGEPDENMRVKRHTCPVWFPALSREVDKPPTSLHMTETAVHKDTLYVGLIGGQREIPPNSWIIHRAHGVMEILTPEDFNNSYRVEVCE